MNAAMNWWVHPSGSELNGGGFDSTVSGAGTNYCDGNQSTPILSLTDVVTIGTTHVTSVTGGFTSQMVGNVIRIAGDGYYVIAMYTNTNTIEVERNTGTASGQNARIGGAHANINSYANGGAGTQPILASPLAAGHTVNIRGGGTDDPAAADYAALDYLNFPAGDLASGPVTWLGYNGRPCLSPLNGLIFYTFSFHVFRHLKFLANGTTYPNNGLLDGNGSADSFVDDCYIDAAGIDTVGVQCNRVTNSRFSNSGSTSVGTNTRAAISPAMGNAFVCFIAGNRIKDWRGDGFYLTSGYPNFVNNVITGCKVNGLEIVSNNDARGGAIVGNTIHGHTGDGILLSDRGAIGLMHVFNNIITGNGGYGINCAVGATALNDRRINGKFDYNNFGTGGTANTSGARNNHSAGAHDVALDPQFANTAADDYSVGTNMKAIGFPHTFPT